jgi:hypothetical protein
MEVGLHLEERRTRRLSFSADLKIEGTHVNIGSGQSGWRITTTDTAAGQELEYWVHGGRIFHVQFSISPPWNHQTPFVIGRQVRHIEASRKQAILQAVKDWLDV